MKRPLTILLVLAVFCLLGFADNKTGTKSKPVDKPAVNAVNQIPTRDKVSVAPPQPIQKSVASDATTSHVAPDMKIAAAPMSKEQQQLNELVQQRKELEVRGENLKVIDGQILQALQQLRGPREPANPLDQGADACPATVIGSLPFADSGHTYWLVDDYTPSCSNSYAPDVIYQYTTAVAGTYTVSLCGGGTDFDTILELRVDGNCPGDNLLACNDDWCGLQSEITASLASGVTLYIIVDGYGGNSGNYWLSVSGPPPVAPDVCPGTTITSVPFSETWNTSGMANDYSPACGIGTAPDAVYNFTPAVSGTHTISLCGSSFDTILDVRYDGACPGNTSVACDDDYCAPGSQVTPYLNAGTTYYILVDGFGTSSGTYTLNVTRQVPLGDDCTNPYTFFSLPFVDDGNTCSFADDLDQACQWTSTSSDVIYMYSPPFNQQVTFSLCHSSYDTKLYIVYGSCDSGILLACSDDAPDCPCAEQNYRSYIECVQLLYGITYYIVVDGYGGACGDYVLMAAGCPTCDVTQQAGDIVEAAEDCSDPNFPDNDPDGGCFYTDTPGQFGTISSGQTIFGRVFCYPYSGSWALDTDYFMLPPLNNDSLIVTVLSESRVGIQLRDSSDCLLGEIEFADPCYTQTFHWNRRTGSNYALGISDNGYSAPVPRDYRLSLQVISGAPPNDDCANAIPLTVNDPNPTCGTTIDATRDCLQNATAEVWYSFVLNECADVQVQLCGTPPGGNFSLGLYLDSCCGTVRNFDWSEQTTCADGHVTIHFDGLPAGPYWLPIQHYNPSGPFCVRVVASSGLPQQVTGVSATDNNCNNVVITWNDVANESDYYVMRNGGIFDTVAANVTTCVDVPGPGTYAYTVMAHNSCGYGQHSAPDNGTRLASVAQVTGLVASDTQCDGILVSWNDLPNETGWRVFRDYLPAFTCSVPDCTHWLDTWSGTHFYEVQGFNVCGFGDVAGPETGTRLAPPPQVTGVLATDDGCDNIVISWNDVDTETAYMIIGDSGIQDTVDADVTVYVDVPPPGMYNYIVIAYNGCGNGPNSEFETGTRLNAVTSPVNVSSPPEGAIVFSGVPQEYCWETVPEATSYRIEWDDDSTFATPLTATTTTTCYTQTLGLPLGTWYWHVRAENVCGWGEWTRRLIELLAVTPPTLVCYYGGNDEIELWWEEVPGASYYVVWWADSPDGPWYFLEMTPYTALAVAAASEKQYYCVSAVFVTSTTN